MPLVRRYQMSRLDYNPKHKHELGLARSFYSESPPMLDRNHIFTFTSISPNSTSLVTIYPQRLCAGYTELTKLHAQRIEIPEVASNRCWYLDRASIWFG